ncbi:MAG: glycosyltransferase family 4 protein [Bacilli bacterium]|nr:glycosyltransferase family 4 protein [Bacilli bacterium]
MGKKLILISALNPWSMGIDKGAPSFNETIKVYKSNWDVHYLTMINSNSKKLSIEDVTIYTHRSFLSRLVTVRKIGWIFRIINSWIATYNFIKTAKKIINNTKGDLIVVYAYEVHAVKAGKYISKKYNLPLVTRFQGTVLSNMKNNFINRIRKYPHFSALKTHAELVIMTNDGTFGKDTLINLGNTSKNILFLRNGVDIGRDYIKNSLEEKKIRNLYSINDDDIILMTVSRLVNWKRIDRAIDIIERLVQLERNNIKLLIVGDGDEKSNLISIVKQKKLTNNIIFVGSIPHNKIQLYIATTDIFLSLYEISNLGNPLFEAMMIGKPIITINVGATATIIKNNLNGILLEDFDVTVAVNQIQLLLEDNTRMEFLGHQANLFARKNFLSWTDRMEIEVDAVEKILQEYQHKIVK